MGYSFKPLFGTDKFIWNFGQTCDEYEEKLDNKYLRIYSIVRCREILYAENRFFGCVNYAGANRFDESVTKGEKKWEAILKPYCCSLCLLL